MCILMRLVAIKKLPDNDGHAFAEMVKKQKKGSGAEMLFIQPRYKSEDNNITIWLFIERNETKKKKTQYQTNKWLRPNSFGLCRKLC